MDRASFTGQSLRLGAFRSSFGFSLVNSVLFNFEILGKTKTVIWSWWGGNSPPKVQGHRKRQTTEYIPQLIGYLFARYFSIIKILDARFGGQDAATRATCLWKRWHPATNNNRIGTEPNNALRKNAQTLDLDKMQIPIALTLLYHGYPTPFTTV